MAGANHLIVDSDENDDFCPGILNNSGHGQNILTELQYTHGILPGLTSQSRRINVHLDL